jgi:hypothetical protein
VISSSATDRDARLLGVDLLEGRPLLEAGDLALGGVALGDGEVRGGADLLRHGRHPLEQALEPCPRRQDVSALEVDQLAGEPVADRAPHVLLDQAVRLVRGRLAFVVRTRDPGRERGAEGRE